MWREKTLELGPDRSLHLHQAGAGPDVVLIHGALTTGHDWLHGPVAPALAATCRVTIVDRPGHGRSRRPRFEGTPRDQARQIAAGLAQLSITRPVIVGHSFGGLVALALAEPEAAAVAGLVLVSPIVFPEPRMMEHGILAPRAVPIMGPLFSQFASWTDRAMMPFIQKLMFAPAEVPPRWRDSFPYDLVANADHLVREGEDAAAILPLSPFGTLDFTKIAAPTHILTGTSDRVVQDETQAKALGRLLPQGRITEIEGAGHMLHHSHPDPILAAIAETISLPA